MKQKSSENESNVFLQKITQNFIKKMVESKNMTDKEFIRTYQKYKNFTYAIQEKSLTVRFDD